MAEVRDSGVLGGEDPLLGFAFYLDLEGADGGYFTEVSGIGAETEIVEQKVIDRNGNPVILKVPGKLKWGDITLKRGITRNMDLWDWREKVNQGRVSEARANGSITMMDSEYTPVARWDFVNAWPSKISGPALKVDSNEFGVEEITIVHEGIKRVS
jgi:phage tail-like protein